MFQFQKYYKCCFYHLRSALTSKWLFLQKLRNLIFIWSLNPIKYIQKNFLELWQSNIENPFFATNSNILFRLNIWDILADESSVTILETFLASSARYSKYHTLWLAIKLRFKGQARFILCAWAYFAFFFRSRTQWHLQSYLILDDFLIYHLKNDDLRCLKYPIWTVNEIWVILYQGFGVGVAKIEADSDSGFFC